MKAYDGDTRSQLDLLGYLHPRRATSRVFSAVSDSDPPHRGGPQAVVSTEGADGRPSFEPSSPPGVAPLEVGTYGNLVRQGAVGDNLTPDHIPSFAAVRAKVERESGQQLSAAEAAELRRSTNCLVIAGCQHREASRTYGGRNSASQIRDDSVDLRSAQERDLAALRSRLVNDGFSEQQIDDAFERLRHQNATSGKMD